MIIGCLFAAVCIGVIMVMHRSEGRMARITCDGVEVAVIAFGESETGQGEKFYLIRNVESGAVTEVFDVYPALPDEGNFNLLSVTDGKVRMEAADCRDQICVRHRPVSDSGESIICLPHRFVVEITDHAEGSAGNAEPVRDIQEDTEVILDGVVE